MADLREVVLRLGRDIEALRRERDQWRDLSQGWEQQYLTWRRLTGSVTTSVVDELLDLRAKVAAVEAVLDEWAGNDHPEHVKIRAVLDDVSSRNVTP